MLFSELITALNRGDSQLIAHDIAQNPNIEFAASLEKAQINQISFLEESSLLKKYLKETKASAIIIPDSEDLISLAKEKNLSWVSCKDPRIAFAECLDLIYPQPLPKEGIHETAVLGDNVYVAKGVSIGANVCIGNNCKIGMKSIIHAGVVIYDDVQIGEGTILHANSVIHRNSTILDECVIHSNAVIGSEGFGFIPTSKGWKKMPQTGVVVLENKVEVGCGSTIDRPAVGETRIGSDTKIDNLVQIGHGVTTGKGCAMASQVGIAGGAKLGNGVILAGQVGVGNRVQVGDRVIASSKCGIHTDIGSDNVISGFPALPNKLWLRCSANFKKLPEIAKSLKDLNQKHSH